MRHALAFAVTLFSLSACGGVSKSNCESLPPPPSKASLDAQGNFVSCMNKATKEIYSDQTPAVEIADKALNEFCFLEARSVSDTTVDDIWEKCQIKLDKQSKFNDMRPIIVSAAAHNINLQRKKNGVPLK